MTPIDGFFESRHVVLVGASRTPGRLGHTLARNLVSRGFTGRVDFVNPQGGTLFDRPVLASLDDVQGAPDLAVLLIPARDVPETVERLADLGVRHVIVASGGFSETGPEGAALEHALRGVATRCGVRLVGPNCVGLIDTGTGLDTSFLSGQAVPPGRIAFVSHSGAICASVIEWARDGGFGLSRLVSLGNQVDLGETDALEAAAEDPRTEVVCCYLERVSDGRRFVQACRSLARTRPVVALKAGRSAAGSRAASSHTGALAGLDAAFEAAFDAGGVLRARSTEDLVDAARVLARYPGMDVRRLAILTNAGGPGVAAADAAEEAGLLVEPLAAGTAEALAAMLPPEASLANPVDMLASASAAQYGQALDLLLRDASVDGVAVLLPPPPGYPAELAAEAIRDAAAGHEKPVVVALLGSDGVVLARQVLAEARIPTFRYAEQAVRGLSWFRKARLASERPDPEPVRRSFPSLPLPRPGWQRPSEASLLASALGIPVPPSGSAGTVEEAASVAERIGFPVVLKLDSVTVVHKSDVGGVVLGIEDPETLRREAGRLLTIDPQGRLFVQAMAGPGLDCIVGMVRDAAFGPLVMVGTGGIDVELERDVAFALTPLDRAGAVRLLDRTSIHRRLAARRGRAEVPADSLVGALLAVSAWSDAVAQAAELEINPLRVFPDGSTAALDVRARFSGP